MSTRDTTPLWPAGTGPRKLTDREMLHLAATEAGLVLLTSSPQGKYYARPAGETCGEFEWNPLANNADALDLLVKLKMDLEFFDDQHATVFCHKSAPGYAASVTDAGEVEAALNVRRIIVAAAANKHTWRLYKEKQAADSEGARP